MKVLIIHQTSNQITLRNFFNELAKSETISSLKLLTPIKGYDFFRKKIRENFNDEKMEYETIYGDVFFKGRNIFNPYRKGLLETLFRFKPDTVHLMYEAMSYLSIQLILYKYIFRFKYKIYFFGFENIYPELESMPWYKKIAIRFIKNNIDGGAYANSSGIQTLERLGFNVENIKCTFRPLEIGVTHRQDLFDKSSNVFKVGYVGRITESKGIFRFLEHFDELDKRVEVTVIGSCGSLDDEKRILEFNKNTRIHYIPYIEQEKLLIEMSKIHCLVVPSLSTPSWVEQFGKVIVEGLQAGCVVVGTNSGAIPEVIGNDKLIFNENNFYELPEKLNELVRNPEFYEEMKNYCNNRCIMFSNKTIVSKFIELYK
jgi:glycosyltransferase involved in cell wall biosynthesis